MVNLRTFLKQFFVVNITNTKRIYGLDILRALAILFVVIGHGIKVAPKDSLIREISMHLDFDGVSVFFVLSGFLIGGIIIKILENKGAGLKTLINFWIRRWMRTLPNYFFVLGLLVFVLPFLFTGYIEDSLSEKLKYALFIQNLYSEHPFFFPEAWSLSIEEWFYLLIPALIFSMIGFLRTKPKYAILIISITVLLLVTYFRYYRFVEYPISSLKEWDLIFRKQVITRLDSLMYGIIGAYIAFYSPKLWVRFKIPLLFFGIFLFWLERYLHLFVPDVGVGMYKCVFSFCLTSISTLMVIPYLSNLKIGKGHLFKILTVISLISYSMYLINLSVVQGYLLSIFPEDLSQYAYVRYLCFWLFTIVGSITLYNFIELPFMKLRDKLSK